LNYQSQLEINKVKHFKKTTLATHNSNEEIVNGRFVKQKDWKKRQNNKLSHQQQTT